MTGVSAFTTSTNFFGGNVARLQRCQLLPLLYRKNLSIGVNANVVSWLGLSLNTNGCGLCQPP